MRHTTLATIAMLSAFACASAQTVTLSRDEFRQIALEQSEDIKIQTNSIKQSELDKGIAFTGYLPKIDAMGMGVYMSDIEMSGMDMVMQGTYLAGITLTQPIYAGGKIIAGNRMAKIGQEIADEQLRKTRADVLADADNSYWTYIAVRQKVKMLGSIKSLIDTLYAQTGVAVEAGMATESDLLTISSKRSEIEYQMQKARNGADLCRLSLCYTAGLDPETEIIPTDTLITVSPRPMDGGDASLRPEIAMMEKQIEINRQQIKSARGDMLPMVGLTAGYTYFGNIKMEGTTMMPDGSSYNYSQEMKQGLGVAMLAVQIPICHWGEGRKKVKKAKLDLLNSQLALQKNTYLINIEIRQATQNLEEPARHPQPLPVIDGDSERDARRAIAVAAIFQQPHRGTDAVQDLRDLLPQSHGTAGMTHYI